MSDMPSATPKNSSITIHPGSWITKGKFFVVFILKYEIKNIKKVIKESNIQEEKQI